MIAGRWITAGLVAAIACAGISHAGVHVGMPGAVKSQGRRMEGIKTPAAPTGPTGGMAGNNYTYSVIGAVTSQGQALEYRFNWGDGGHSPWSPATSAVHSWGVAGLYSVRAEARYGSRTASSPALAVAMAAQ